MMERDTDRSRGCSCVEIPDTHTAQDVMAARNGTHGASRALTVSEARPREPHREPRQPRC
jgi:hypothetical protein